MAPADTIQARIRGLPAFAGIPDEEMNRLFDEVSIRELDVDDVLIVEGEVAQVAYLILEGTVQVSRSAGDGDVVVATRHEGELVGEMALLMEARRNATVRAQTPVTVVEITADSFQSVLASRPETAISMLRTVWDRLQSAEAHLVQHQKMAALGTIAAGLAHELNNPASALIRSAGQLADVIARWEENACILGGMSLDEIECDTVDGLRQSLDDVEPLSDQDPLAQSDLEERVQAWLAARDIDRPWVLAPLLADAGVDVADLDRLARTVQAEHLPPVIWWYGHGALVQRLLGELSLSGKAISEVVTAVKGYTRLDQAPIQEINIHEGIDQALVILRHKLKGIRVERQYDHDLPRITAYAGEINQVWTNLIDNAADAMNGSGVLTIRTRLDGCDIVVDVQDTGPGIPDSALDCVFNPFFTTKPPGVGTGLGLAISFNIARKHGGDMDVESMPGCTRFSVRLPLKTAVE
ncbi:MAG: ATP-binding protein [Thermomicrobiales bacterium]